MPEQMIRIPRSIGPLKIRPQPSQSDEPKGRPTEAFGEFACGISQRARRYDPELLTEISMIFFPLQMEIAKRLNGIIAQLLPFLSQEV